MIAEDEAAGRQFLAVPQHLSLAMSLSASNGCPHRATLATISWAGDCICACLAGKSLFV
jgi:hypothetical protein